MQPAHAAMSRALDSDDSCIGGVWGNYKVPRTSALAAGPHNGHHTTTALLCGKMGVWMFKIGM